MYWISVFQGSVLASVNGFRRMTRVVPACGPEGSPHGDAGCSFAAACWLGDLDRPTHRASGRRFAGLGSTAPADAGPRTRAGTARVLPASVRELLRSS